MGNDSKEIVEHELKLGFDGITVLAKALGASGRCDAALAPMWAEKLRFTYTTVLEQKYPELAFASGGVLPIDTSPPPYAIEWEYFLMDEAGYADWIDDDGHIAPNSAVLMKRFTGGFGEMGHKWDVTIMDLERAAALKLPLNSIKAKKAREYHERKTNWVWAFGDSAKGIFGLCNHPNITITMAPLNVGATSRLWANKTVDEIAADMALLVDTIATNTIREYYAAKVFMPHALMVRLRNLRLGAGDGFASVYAWMQDRYKGDDTGQGKVTFAVLNECSASLRQNPITRTDDSGITGDFLLALPPDNKEELAFIRARPFTQRPPQEVDFVISNLSHSKIGGCKCQIPLAVHRLDFGIV